MQKLQLQSYKVTNRKTGQKNAFKAKITLKGGARGGLREIVDRDTIESEKRKRRWRTIFSNENSLRWI